MHSKDFIGIGMLRDGGKLEGKTQKEWEDHFEATGIIEHLKSLGWKSYQWRYVSPEQFEQTAKMFREQHGMEPPRDGGCFAEFFSEYYSGYLRGDGKTVREAMLHCLTVAQKYAACENGRGHEYVPYKRGPKGEEYKNGLVMCKHCGFNGHTTLVKNLQDQVNHLQISLEVEKVHAAERVRHIEEKGERWEVAFERDLKEVIGGLAGVEDKQQNG